MNDHKKKEAEKSYKQVLCMYGTSNRITTKTSYRKKTIHNLKLLSEAFIKPYKKKITKIKIKLVKKEENGNERNEKTQQSSQKKNLKIKINFPKLLRKNIFFNFFGVTHFFFFFVNNKKVFPFFVFVIVSVVVVVVVVI